MHTTHTSLEIAQAIVARAFPRYPQAVELPAEECQECGGAGGFLASNVPWDDSTVACDACRGTGTVTPKCDCCCGRDATTAIFDGAPAPLTMCERHALDQHGLDGESLAVAFALRVLP